MSRWLMLMLILLVLPTCPGRAAQIVPTPPELLIPKLTVQVDGHLREWDLERYGCQVNPEKTGEGLPSQPLLGSPDNPFKGAGDLSAIVSLAWDPEYLYFCGDVTDEDLRGVRPAMAHNVGPAGWFCDSVMLQLYSFRKPLRSNSPYSDAPNLNARLEVKPGGRAQLIADPNGRLLNATDGFWKLPPSSLLATRDTAVGYIVEAAVPWAELGMVPQVGDTLRACFLLADIDGGETLNQLGWHFSADPRQRPVFRLLGEMPATALLSVSNARPQTGAKWVIRYQVDARGAEVTVTRVALVGEAGEALTLPVGVVLPDGRTASDVLVVDSLAVRPGEYQLRLEGEAGGRALTLCLEPIEVLKGREPAPLIANPPGELHHMRPDRVAHSAGDDHRSGILTHGYVKDRSGYERYLRTHVAAYLDRNMELYLQQKQRHICSPVIMALALYRLTADPKYAGWVRRGLEVALENQKTKLDPEMLLRLCELRHLVWQHDPGTDLSPPDAEADFQRLWARVATDHDESWMFAEWGYHNRCWHRLAIAKISTYFAEKLGQPVSPRLQEYIAWHQPRYEQFNYATDNSSGYHWVGFRFPVYWHTALDTLPRLSTEQRWVEALSRWRRYVSPSGAVPNFGDTSGWNTGVGDALGYFELMGRLTGDGRYRWTAHRIAEYLYNHFWPRHEQYHLPRDQVAEGFCKAWLYADDAVAPQPPEQSSDVTFRTRVLDASEEDKAARVAWSGAKLSDELIPDKLVLTSGNDPQRLWALVELLPQGGHCGELPGHIITLMVHDAVLLAGQGYYERSQDFNNVVWVEDLEGLAADPRPPRTEVPIFVDDANVTWARLVTEPYAGLSITSVRDIVFVKNGFMLVKDRLTFHADLQLRVGPCWQTRDLGPQCGEDWFNTYYEWLYHTGLGLGRGVHAYRNPAWDLLVRFAPRADTRISVLDRYQDNPYRMSPVQLRQSWSGIARAGQSRTFTTILLPHPPAFDVTGFADWARFVRDDDNVTLVQVTVENDDLRHFREKYWVLLQEQPRLVEVEGFASDARLAVIPLDRNDAPRPASLVQGSVLTLQGRDLAVAAGRPAVRSLFELAP